MLWGPPLLFEPTAGQTYDFFKGQYISHMRPPQSDKKKRAIRSIQLEQDLRHPLSKGKTLLDLTVDPSCEVRA